MLTADPPAGYRLCVAALILNPRGEVFLGERRTPANVWQVPQGGIDAGESAEQALIRELTEEIGTGAVSIIGQVEGWLSYDFPPDMPASRLKEKYKGQTQRWFAVRLDAPDNAIALDAHHPPEFRAWQWVGYDQVMDWCGGGFKADVYRAALAALRPAVLALTAETGP